MNNKVLKNLIVFGIIIFSLILTNNVFADYDPYDSSNWLIPVTSNRSSDYDDHNNFYYSNQGYGYRQSGYTTYDPYTGRPTVVNNYYYQSAPSSTTKTSNSANSKVATTTSTKTSVKNTDDISNDYTNNLGASAYNSRSNIPALSLQGSGGFMPSSIWQWILVIILILIIIIISRMLMRKRVVVAQESHTIHAH